MKLNRAGENDGSTGQMFDSDSQCLAVLNALSKELAGQVLLFRVTTDVKGEHCQ
ncbi:hypothetical protein ETAR_14820 [Edwardsiella tarda]